MTMETFTTNFVVTVIDNERGNIHVYPHREYAGDVGLAIHACVDDAINKIHHEDVTVLVSPINP